jgi:putative ABC transport system permease protein
MNVIGIVKDFHRRSLHQKIEPLILFYDPSAFSNLSIKIATDDISQTMNQLEKKWQEIIPQRPFNFFFLDEYMDRLYQVEERIGEVSLYFSLLAIFIGCLGLFGLAAFMAEKRTKEIGIRKLHGASVLNIVKLQSKEFIILVVIANAVAWPLAYFGLSQWLQDFAYRTGLSWWIFTVTGVLAVLIALMTVSYQSIKAALINPVDALKYE